MLQHVLFPVVPSNHQPVDLAAERVAVHRPAGVGVDDLLFELHLGADDVEASLDVILKERLVVEDEPSRALLREMEVTPPDTLFGLYTGTPLTERDATFGNNLPDRILLFQGPHEREAEDHEDLIVSIAETLIHEIGHYFGLSEDQIQEIEDEYWHSFAPPDESSEDEPAG